MSGQQRESRMSARPPGPQPCRIEWPPEVDTTVAHSARRYDYWLGGKDNFAADRESGDAIAAAFPTVRTAVIENRRFVRRATRYLKAVRT
jgi:S-adenosyl methyltransferase